MFWSNLSISPPALLQGSKPTVFECSQFIIRLTHIMDNWERLPLSLTSLHSDLNHPKGRFHLMSYVFTCDIIMSIAVFLLLGSNTCDTARRDASAKTVFTQRKVENRGISKPGLDQLVNSLYV